jgi:hypothetical protein
MKNEKGKGLGFRDETYRTREQAVQHKSPSSGSTTRQLWGCLHRRLRSTAQPVESTVGMFDCNRAII